MVCMYVYFMCGSDYGVGVCGMVCVCMSLIDLRLSKPADQLVSPEGLPVSPSPVLELEACYLIRLLFVCFSEFCALNSELKYSSFKQILYQLIHPPT